MATINTNTAIIANTNTVAEITFDKAVVAFNQAVRAWKGEYLAMYGENFDRTEACYDVSFYSFTGSNLIEAAHRLSEFGGGEFGSFKLYSQGYIYTHPYSIQHVLKGRRLFATITTRNDDIWIGLTPAGRANIGYLDGVEARRRANDEYKAAREECLKALVRGKALAYTVGHEGGYVHFEGRNISARGLAVKADTIGYDIEVGGGRARAVLDTDEDFGFERPMKVRRQFAYNPQRVNQKLVLRALDHARRESEIAALLR